MTVKEGSSSRIYVPVTNQTRHDISQRGRIVLGVLQQVRTVLPCPSECAPTDETVPTCKAQVNKFTAQSLSISPEWTPHVDLSHLTVEQRRAAEKMLKEEAGASFAKDDDDMDCIKNLQMNIQLNDDKPVQKSYLSVPRPLYQEVKEYLQDLMKRGWITKSSSP